MKTQISLKERVYRFYQIHKQQGKLYCANHFIDEGETKSTIYHHLKCAEENKPLARKKGSGRIAKIATKKNIAFIKKQFNHKYGRSQKKVAKKIKTTQGYISKILKKHTNIVCRKRVKKPKRTLKQQNYRPKCRKLLEKFKNCQWILDDESFFTLSNSTLSGNDRFYSDDLNKTPEHVKCFYKSKFEPKILVWLAISPAGVSSAFFAESKQAINQDVYLKDCIQKRLIPFINAHHNSSEYVFWPDLASSHYAKKVVNFLKEQNIQFVPKDINPANLPEARPIEDFWADLKRDVYSNGWEAKNIQQLKARINNKLKNIDQNLVQSRALETPKRLDKIRRYGIN